MLAISQVQLGPIFLSDGDAADVSKTDREWQEINFLESWLVGAIGASVDSRPVGAMYLKGD